MGRHNEIYPAFLDKISQCSVIQLLPWLTTDIDSYTSLGTSWQSCRKDDLCGSFRRKDIDRKQMGSLMLQFVRRRADYSFWLRKWKWSKWKKIICFKHSAPLLYDSSKWCMRKSNYFTGPNNFIIKWISFTSVIIDVVIWKFELTIYLLGSSQSYSA